MILCSVGPLDIIPCPTQGQNIDTALGVRGWEEGRQMGHGRTIIRLSSFVKALSLF